MRRADITVRKLIESRQPNEKIYTLGALIHNSIYTKELEERGVTNGWDALYKSYETEGDPAKRAEISLQMQEKNFNECYAIPGYIQATYNAWNEANVYIPETAFAYGGSNYHWDEWQILK